MEVKVKSNFAKVNPGDWVCTAMNGWCLVIEVDRQTNVFNVGGWWFTLEGKLNGGNDGYPTCFTKDNVPDEYIELFGEAPPVCEDGDRVWVSNDGHHWHSAVFKQYSDDPKYPFEVYAVNTDSLYRSIRAWDDVPEGYDGD